MWSARKLRQPLSRTSCSLAVGLSTLNRELAIHLSQHPKVEVSLLVPEGACKDEDTREANSYGVTVVDAKERPGYGPLDWLSFPPQDLSMHVVVGHGVKLGRQGQVIRDNSTRFPNCKCMQVVHTAPEDLSRCKSYSDPIAKGEKKHQVEVDPCKMADLLDRDWKILTLPIYDDARRIRIFSLSRQVFLRENLGT